MACLGCLFVTGTEQAHLLQTIVPLSLVGVGATLASVIAAATLEVGDST